MDEENNTWDEVPQRQSRPENRSILVVDDDPDLCGFVQEALENAEYRVQVAKDGVAALAALAREIPDVLLLDIRMPRISGDEILDMLSTIERHPPIIVMTAAAVARDRALAHRNPFYLPKPFDETLLLATVETALESMSGSREPPPESPESDDSTPHQ